MTHDISRYTKAKIFSEIGKQTPMFARISTVAGERGAADAESDIRGFAIKFYTEEGNWDIVSNNTPAFFFRDPLRFSDLNHAIKRDPRTGLRSADNNWDFWSDQRVTASASLSDQIDTPKAALISSIRSSRRSRVSMRCSCAAG